MPPSALLYQAALKHLGVREVPGPKSHKLIQGWIKQAATWLDGDDSKTAWCGCFRGSLGLETSTGVPRAHFRALNWLAWGRPVKLEDAIQGDTVIVKRPGGAHVALLHSVSGRTLHLLGGNQGDAVTIAPYRTADLLGIRR